MQRLLDQLFGRGWRAVKDYMRCDALCPSALTKLGGGCRVDHPDLFKHHGRESCSLSHRAVCVLHRSGACSVRCAHAGCGQRGGAWPEREGKRDRAAFHSLESPCPKPEDRHSGMKRNGCGKGAKIWIRRSESWASRGFLTPFSNALEHRQRGFSLGLLNLQMGGRGADVHGRFRSHRIDSTDSNCIGQHQIYSPPVPLTAPVASLNYKYHLRSAFESLLYMYSCSVRADAVGSSSSSHLGPSLPQTLCRQARTKHSVAFLTADPGRPGTW